jgi:magnesium transporter
MLDAIIDRLADELEGVSGDMEQLSGHIFHKDMDERRIPAARLTALLTRIGRTQTLLTKIRYSTVSTMRMLSFLSGANRFHEEGKSDVRHHLTSLSTDVTSLSEHASFLSDNLQFLLDASLGLISIEQNAAMKLFSWAAVVFLPPTLIAGIFGMNFHYMPELKWHYGYPISLALMLASAVGPYLYFKKRGWI